MENNAKVFETTKLNKQFMPIIQLKHSSSGLLHKGLNECLL
jgi:hypothetical protein